MFFREVLNEDLGCASYVVVADGGEAAVVDPKWGLEEYLKIAEGNGFSISRILETHNHAGPLSGLGQAPGAIAPLVKPVLRAALGKRWWEL